MPVDKGIQVDDRCVEEPRQGHLRINWLILVQQRTTQQSTLFSNSFQTQIVVQTHQFSWCPPQSAACLKALIKSSSVWRSERNNQLLARTNETNATIDSTEQNNGRDNDRVNEHNNQLGYSIGSRTSSTPWDQAGQICDKRRQQWQAMTMPTTSDRNTWRNNNNNKPNATINYSLLPNEALRDATTTNNNQNKPHATINFSLSPNQGQRDAATMNCSFRPNGKTIGDDGTATEHRPLS